MTPKENLDKAINDMSSWNTEEDINALEILKKNKTNEVNMESNNSTKQFDIDDPDLAIKLVNANKLKASLNAEFTKKMSVRAPSVKYKSEYIPPKKNFKARVLAVALAVTVCLGGAAATVKDAKNTLKINELVTEIATPLTESVQAGGYNPNTQTPYWWYNSSMSSIAKEISEKYPNYDVDSIIYSCYYKLRDYNKEEYMNQIVHTLTEYSTFKEYLAAKNIESLKDYEKIMNNIILQYANLNESLDNLNEDPSFGGR